MTASLDAIILTHPESVRDARRVNCASPVLNLFLIDEFFGGQALPAWPLASMSRMRGVLAYIYGMLWTLLPSRYRQHESLRGHAIACGILQGFAAVLLIVYRMFDFVAQTSDAMGKRSELLYDHIGGGAVYASGVLALAEFAFQAGPP